MKQTNIKPRPMGEVDAYADGEGKKVSFNPNNLSGVYAASSPKRRAFEFEQPFVRSVLKAFRQTDCDRIFGRSFLVIINESNLAATG